MDEFKDIDTVEDLFKDLETNNAVDAVRPLAAYRNALMKEGFTRREAMRLVENYSRFLFDVMMDEMVEKRREEFDALEENEEDRVGSDDEDPDDFV